MKTMYLDHIHPLPPLQLSPAQTLWNSESHVGDQFWGLNKSKQLYEGSISSQSLLSEG